MIRTVLVLIGAVAFGLNAPVGIAQVATWDPGVPKGFFKDEKPPNRLRDPKCKDCKEAMAKLQGALDDWYAMELTEGQADKKEAVGIQDNDKNAAKNAEGNGKIAEAKAGLGQPKDAGKAAQKKQEENSKKDAADKANKGMGAKDVLKEKIKKLLKELEDCEKKCPPPAEQAVQPETPTPKPVVPGGGGKTQVPAPPAFDIVIPTLPPCFDTERDREAYRKKLAELQEKITKLRKANDVLLAEPPDQAWKDYKDKLQKASEAIQEQNFPGDDGKDAIDKAKVPCPKGGGGGPAKGKTPGKPKAPRVRTGHNVSLDGGPTEDFCALISEDKIDVDFTGTGETCGHVADCRISNLTDETISCVIPPMVLESKSGKNQDYACPQSETVDVGPKSSKTVPIRGVCVARNKPPVNKDSGDDLKINNCDGDSRIPDDNADKFLNIATSIFQAADELLKGGDLKEIPYKDPEKKKDIVVQWATWADPEISEMTGVPPATKEDLKKVVYKQVEEKGPMTPKTKEKVDEGIDTIFEKIELTTKKAKDLEESAQSNPPQAGGGSMTISNDTPTPGPGTQEKPKKDKKDKKKKNKYLQSFDWWNNFVKEYPFVDWLEKKMKAGWADQVKDKAADDYNQKFRDFLGPKKSYNDLKQQRDDAEKKANAPGATQQDKDAFNKLDSDLKKLENDFKQDFNKTDDGKKAMGDLHEAEKAADKAHDAEKDAGKNIDPASKEAIENYMKDNPPPPELLHPPDPVQAFW